jgi:hypothetical protein
MRNKGILVNCVLLAILIIACAVGSYFQFQCVKEHFPEMTYFEYIFTQDKIRIVPYKEKNVGNR